MWATYLFAGLSSAGLLGGLGRARGCSRRFRLLGFGLALTVAAEAEGEVVCVALGGGAGLEAF